MFIWAKFSEKQLLLFFVLEKLGACWLRPLNKPYYVDLKTKIVIY